MKYSDKEMAALIAEVETNFAQHLAKAEKPAVAVEVKPDLQKSEDTEGFDYDDEDKAEMHKMYKSMNKKEKEAHYGSLKKALFGEEENEGDNKVKEEPKKEHEAKESKEKEESEEDKKAKKEKEDKEKEDKKVEKSEVDTLKLENAELKKNLEKLVSTMNASMKKGPPAQKAITQIQYITKSEEVAKEIAKPDVTKLDKSEITKLLTVKTRDAKLSKSDREAINDYCLAAKPSLDTIKHLL